MKHRYDITAALLIAVSVLAAAFTLTPLFVPAQWLLPVALAVVVLTLAGILLRRRLSPGQTLAWQLGLALALIVWEFGGSGRDIWAPAGATDPGALSPDGQPSSSRSGSGSRSTLIAEILPTPDTLRLLAALTRSASETISAAAPPVHVTVGLTFLLTVSLLAVFLAAHALAVWRRLPALAGLPLVLPYLVALANGDGQSAIWPFLLLGVCWMALLYMHDRDIRERWPSRTVRARGGRGVRRRRAPAALLAGATLLLSLGAGLLPHMPSRYLVDGLGRSSANGTVGFSDTVELSQDLRNDDLTPVLTYTTTDPNPPPLRLAVSESYVNGRWAAAPTNLRPTTSPVVTPPVGLSQEVKRTQREITVTQTRVAAPYVALPYGITGGVVNNAEWAWSEDLGVGAVNTTPDHYTIPYLSIDPTRAQMGEPLTSAPDENVLAVPDQDADELGRVAEEVRTQVMTDETAAYRDASGGGSRGSSASSLDEANAEDASYSYRYAVAVQNYLRSSRFTYSLTLAPAPRGMSSEQARSQALSLFLRSRRGYCVQFATAMVMLARMEGIPARLVTGYLPGSADADKVYTIRRSDAHAWPELFFDGVGWVRFEPTPGSRSGTPPAYAPAPSPSVSASASSTSSPASTPRATPSATHPSTRPSATARPSATPVAPGISTGASLPTWVRSLAVTVAGALLLALALAARPLLVSSRYRRLRAAAPTPEGADLATWDEITTRFADLGFRADAAASPPDQADALADSAHLEPPARTALTALAARVERARYAPPGAHAGRSAAVDHDRRRQPSGGGTHALPADLHSAVVHARRGAGRSRRVTATLWPRLPGRTSVLPAKVQTNDTARQ